MNHQASRIFDVDLRPHDVLSLNGADTVLALFAHLGYHTAARILQTPGNLGITAESTVRPIKRIELIADQEGLFQVYLFELANVTVTHTRALARAFRNRAGNYLLVLTSDYERLDFVLLEKYLPTGSSNGSGLAQKQVGIRPRVLTVERRKPGPVHLRALRRLTWTESDPLAQYDKLLSAYAVADWSEEFFNNRALFSDYYLLERLPESPAWTEDPKPSYLRLRERYQGAASRFAGKEKEFLQKELLEPVLQILGLEVKPGKRSTAHAVEPDYRLVSQDHPSPPLALCLVYPWGRSLDGKDDQRDNKTPEENPGAVVVSLLEKGEAPWVMVTNGKLWRLYAQRAHSRATNYYEIDLEEVLAQAGPHAVAPAESFRYFWLLFRRQALEPVQIEREGKALFLPFLDRLLVESEDYAKELGDRLKERVFAEVFPHLATGFIAHLRERDGLHANLSQEVLDAVFQGTLTLLYRLLFLLYAEARDLLPVKEVRGYFEVSLAKLKREVAEAAGSIADEVEERLKQHYRESHYELYDRLARLCQVMDRGDPALNVPVYNGGLFLSAPEEGDKSPEARAARFLSTAKVPDRFLARAIDLLARDVDPKRHDLLFIDYKSLGVRQLGSIYEGLLEFKLRIASQRLAIVKEKGREVYEPFHDLNEKDRERAERQGRVIRKGQAYLENDKRERKATGSYYTPDPIVKYIVEHAVGPVLQEKFDTMRPKLREAQQKRRAFFQKQEALRKQGLKPEPESKADLIGQELVGELFDLKVLDPAMGSGHFLVEAVDYITDKALDFLNAFPWNPVFAHLARMRNTILQEMDDQGITLDAKRLTDVNLLKRQVLKRCIYGVDLNPMAVELAKVSLWLDCFTLGAPLSFLDHHLRCGNSLIGVPVREVRDAVEPVIKLTGRLKVDAGTEWKTVESKAEQFTLFGSRFAGLLLATDLMRHVGELSDITSAQVQESRAEYRKASDALAPFKRILNIYTSQWFGNGGEKKGPPRQKGPSDSLPVAFLKSRLAEAFINAGDDQALKQALDRLSPQDRRIGEIALAAAAEKRFFHWELEFSEVFYGPRTGTQQAIERLEGAGFDAVIGNPPYVRQEGLGENKVFFEVAHAPVYSGVADLYVYFYHRGLSLCRKSGRFGMITSNKFLRAGYGKGLRTFLAGHTITDLIDFRDLPVFPDVTAYPLVLIARRDPPPERHAVRAYTVEGMAEASQIGEVMSRQAPSIPFTVLREEGWTLQRPEVLRLLEKVRAAGRPLEEVVEGKFYYGIKTGYNEAFVIDEARRAELIAADPKSAEIIKPFLRGRDIKRWRLEWAGLYLIFTRRGIDIDRYPAIKAHLLPMKDQLMPGVSGGRKPGSYKWYEIQDAIDYYAELEKPKIIYPDIYEHQSFAYDITGYLLANTIYFIPTNEKYIVAILNSNLIEFYYRNTSAQVRGGYMRAFSSYVGQIPITQPSKSDCIALDRHVEAILVAPDDPVTVAEHERDIDEIIYCLYGLTEEEIAIVEKGG